MIYTGHQQAWGHCLVLTWPVELLAWCCWSLRGSMHGPSCGLGSLGPSKLALGLAWLNALTRWGPSARPVPHSRQSQRQDHELGAREKQLPRCSPPRKD